MNENNFLESQVNNSNNGQFNQAVFEMVNQQNESPFDQQNGNTHKGGQYLDDAATNPVSQGYNGGLEHEQSNLQPQQGQEQEYGDNGGQNWDPQQQFMQAIDNYDQQGNDGGGIYQEVNFKGTELGQDGQDQGQENGNPGDAETGQQVQELTEEEKYQQMQQKQMEELQKVWGTENERKFG